MIQEDEASIGKGKIGSHDFMMFQYKISLCPKQGQKHEWEQCVCAHRGERARRRHPSKYQAVQCPEARAKKLCPRADDCNCTHNLWEYWLHPDRYMTCLCELGPACNRRICFFAHEQHELRPLPPGLSHPDEDMFPRPPRKERHQSNSTGSSSTHSSTQHLQQQSARDPGVPAQQQQRGGGLPRSGSASSSRPGSSLGATAGPMQLPAAGRAVEQRLTGAFKALELLSLPGNQAAAAAGAVAVSSPLQVQLPLQQQPGSDMPPFGSAAAAAGLHVLAAPALPSPTGLTQQQHQRASSAPTLVPSWSFGVLSSSPTPQQQQHQLAGALLHQPGQQALPRLLGTVSRQGSGPASSASASPVLQGVPTRPQAGFGPEGQALVRTSLDMHAVRTGRSLSDGYTPAGLPASAAVLQLQALPQQALAGRMSVSIPDSSCSPPMCLPVASLSPGRISPMSAGSAGVDSMMGPLMQPAYTTAMMTSNIGMQQQVLQMQQMQRLRLQQQQQQQQQQSCRMPVVMLESLSPTQQAQLQLMQQQQQQTGLTCISQQLMPVQLMDDSQTEHLSFSMWGPETAGPQIYMQQQQVVMPQQLAQQQQQVVQLGQWQQQEMALQQSMPVVLPAMNMPAAVASLSPSPAAALQQGAAGGCNTAAGFQTWNALLQQQQQQQVAFQQQVQQQALLQQQVGQQQQQPGQYGGSPPHPFRTDLLCSGRYSKTYQ